MLSLCWLKTFYNQEGLFIIKKFFKFLLENLFNVPQLVVLLLYEHVGFDDVLVEDVYHGGSEVSDERTEVLTGY